MPSTFTRRHNYPRRRQNDQKETCGRCGFPFYLYQLRFQRGLLVDKVCYDNLDNESEGVIL